MTKNIFAVHVVILLISAPLFPSEYEEVSSLIKRDLFTNRRLILEKSAALTKNQRVELYHKNKKAITVPFLLNALVGLGIGSFFQKDIAGAVIGMTVDLTGWSLVITGSILNIIENGADYNAAIRYDDPLIFISIAGLTLISIGRLFEMIRPFLYAKKYNTTLWRTITSRKPLSKIFIKPMIRVAGAKNYLIGLHMEARF